MKRNAMMASLLLTAAVPLGACLAVGTAQAQVPEQMEIHMIRQAASRAERQVEDEIEEIEEEPEPVHYDIPLSDDLQQYTIALCEERSISPEMVFAVMYRESTFRADAVGDDGLALGLMQIRTDYHWDRMARLGVTDLLDPYQNVLVGVDYLYELSQEYEDASDGLTAYRYGTADAPHDYAFGILEYSAELERSVEK